MQFAYRMLGLVAIAAVIGCSEQGKSYRRNPLVREMNIIASPPQEPETSTQAEPYPPPRPVLPDEPSNVATSPVIQTPERTPAH